MCKSPATVLGADFVKDFISPGVPKLKPGGVAIELGTMNEWPGVNTMGVSMSRILYAPGGLINLRIHPCATEIVYIAKGKIYCTLASWVLLTTSCMVRTWSKGKPSSSPCGLLQYFLVERRHRHVR